METEEKQVSKNIKSIRIKYGLTQEDVAGKLMDKNGKKITLRTYIKIENHPFSYSINKLNSIANIVGCNINEFFLPISFTNSESNL